VPVSWEDWTEAVDTVERELHLRIA
jgi:hypothetical protein